MDDLIAFLRARLAEAAADKDHEIPPQRWLWHLADIDAKRLIVADCERAIARAKASEHGDDYERWPPWSKLAYRTVWNLSQPFAGHPDYRESPFAASVIAFMTWLESESGGRDTP